MDTLTPDETLLGLLAARARHGLATHGYQLLDCFRDPAQLGLVWDLSTSQLYAVLKRLEREGWVTGQALASPDAPPRTEFSITAAGVERLESWLQTDCPSASVRRIRVEFLSRLYICRLLNQPTVTLIRHQKAACHQRRAMLIQQRDEAPPGVGFLTLELNIGQLEAILQWIDRCELYPRGVDE